MKAIYKKEILPDPEKEGHTYTNHVLLTETKFCCKKFKEHCKKFTGWNYDHGKFSIVEQITYEKNSVVLIDFCPFCGEEIQYENNEFLKKSKRKN